MIHLDEQLFLWLNNLGTLSWDGFWLFMTNKYNMAPLYLFLLGFSIWKWGWKKGLGVLGVALLMIAFTDQVTNLFKSGFARLRPCHDPDIAPLMRLVKAKCGGQFGFFSGHASNSFAVALFFVGLFHKQYPHMRWLILWAAIVAYSRVYVGVHYPLDIFCGAIFGTASGYMFHRLYKWFFKV
ncbi:MAG: phosphatase PAP2 family protein [Flavobacteriaceae bacterium]